MKRIVPGILAAAVVLLACSAPLCAADTYEETIATFKKSPHVKPFFENAYGYAVFPHVGKGGLIVGGAYGRGQVYRGNAVTGTTSVVKLNVGFQLGGQVFSEIVFFENQAAYEQFTAGTFEFGASASAVLLTLSAQGEVGTTGNSASATYTPKDGIQANAEYVEGMMVFIHGIGGFMYEASIGGQRFTFTPLADK